MDKFALHLHFCKAKMFPASGRLHPLTPWPGALPLNTAGALPQIPVIGSHSMLAVSPPLLQRSLYLCCPALPLIQVWQILIYIYIPG